MNKKCPIFCYYHVTTVNKLIQYDIFIEAGHVLGLLWIASKNNSYINWRHENIYLVKQSWMINISIVT